MLICGFAQAYIATKDKKFIDEANKIFAFIIKKHFDGKILYHSSFEGALGSKATLDDYANFIKACFLLYTIDDDLNKTIFSKQTNLNSYGNFL